jgi:hypothetical protein
LGGRTGPASVATSRGLFQGIALLEAGSRISTPALIAIATA